MKKKIEEYAVRDWFSGIWVWLPSTLEKYDSEQLERLKERWRRRGYHITIGKNSILDLYKRVKALEKKK